MKNPLKPFLVLGLVIGLVSPAGTLLTTDTAHASDARSFSSGRIIDDSIFTNKNSMSVTDIQNFLNSKVPSCDNNGTKTSELGGGTRAQWLASHGYSTPITCLKQYYENPSTGENNYGKSTIPSGAISAAQIIYNYAQQFTINPQTLIVTLQKENGLVTDEWPTPRQFTQAMGFGCPDNVAPGAPACDPTYGGFSAQMYQAARHFRGFMDNASGWYVPYNTGSNSILWNPTTSCGRSDVYIENRATVALYSYTPYRPNQAALNAQYGTGDGCSSYGNRNFYLYFNDWFGSTNGEVTITTPLTVTSGVSTGLYTKVPTTVSFTVKNNRNYAMGMGNMAVIVRDSQGRNLDYELQPVYLPPFGSYTYTSSQVLPREETYTFSIVDFINGVWRSDYPESSSVFNPRQLTLPVYEMPTQTTDISFDNELRTGRDTVVSFNVKNNSMTSSVNAGKFAVAIRGPNGENYDLAPETVTLTANQTYTYSKTFRPPYEGTYRFFIASTLNNGQTWESSFPQPLNGTIKNNLTAVVKPGVTMTQQLQVSSANPHVGQTIVLSYKVKNYMSSSVDLGRIGMYGRDPQGRNVDPGAAAVTLSPDEEKTISYTQVLNTEGVHRYGVLSTPDNGRTWLSGPVAETAGMQKDVSVNAGPQLTITQGPTLSTTPHVNQAVNISIKVKNYSESSVNLGRIGMYGRDPQGRNVDPGAIDTTLSAGEERTISYSIMPQVTGNFQFGVLQTFGGGVWLSGPVAENASVQKTITVAVKPQVTMTEALASTNYIPTKGASITLTYKLKNFGSTSVDLGRVGLIGRSPSWQNVDPGSALVTLVGGEEKVIIYSTTVPALGIYMYGTIATSDGGRTWNNGPVPESSDLVQVIYVETH